MCRLFLVRAAGLASLCAALAGCGLADYEARMDETQKRVARFDEENRVLGTALEIPMRTKKVKENGKEVVVQEPLADVFLRPPRNISPSAGNKEKPIGGLLYDYPEQKDNANPPQPAPAPDPNQPPLPEPPQVTDLYLAFAQNVKDAKDLESFQFDVLRLFPGYDRKTSPTATQAVEPPGREPLKFSVTSVKDEREKVHYSVWVHHTGKTAVAVAFRIKGQPEALERTLTLCLSTLVVNRTSPPTTPPK